MISFNFIETSFFISLGITFVLILLLIYHFKQRLHITENKQDTMFEIMNNLAQELTSIKEFITIRSNHVVTPHMNHVVNQCFTNNEMISQTDEKSDTIVIDDSDSGSESNTESESDGDNESIYDDDIDEEFDNNVAEKIIVSDADDNISVESITPVITDIIKLSENKPEKKLAKMTLGELKTFILEKGWVEDASKMKKTQIIEMIENHE
jgi:hypothetical protein